MDDALYYLAINRQRGLRAEMLAIANNVANLDTAGFRREGVIFAEHVVGRDVGGSLSMADLDARFASTDQGRLTVTDSELDIAIEGPGFFAIETPEGPVLTRAGRFTRSPEGLLVTADGAPVLDAGQAPVFLPPAGRVSIAGDGTLSVDGQEQARIGVFDAAPEGLRRAGMTGFRTDGEIVALAEPRLRAGAIEGSNVDAVTEIARMIEVSRAYERVQGLIEDEDERIRQAIDRLGRPI